MISEFQPLAEKVAQLAALTSRLRTENIELRRKLVELSESNAQLTGRIHEAHERVSAVLEQLPTAQQETE